MKYPKFDQPTLNALEFHYNLPNAAYMLLFQPLGDIVFNFSKLLEFIVLIKASNQISI